MSCTKAMSIHQAMKPSAFQSLNSFEKDKLIGDRAEIDFFKLMNNQLNLCIKQAGEFCFYDFFNNRQKFVIELKRRQINKDKYDTTIIGYDKIARFEKFNAKKKNEYRFVLVFYFNDGIYYFIHSKGYNYDVSKYRRRPRHDWEEKVKNYVFLPVSELKPIDQLKNDLESKLIVRYA